MTPPDTDMLRTAHPSTPRRFRPWLATVLSLLAACGAPAPVVDCTTTDVCGEGTVCRDGVCVPVDVGDGGTPPSGCGDGALESGEECDDGAANGGAGSCCSAACTLAPAGTVCRAAAGACDLAETCDGSTSACGPDAFAPQGAPGAGGCGAYTCTGDGPDCASGCDAAQLCAAGYDCVSGACEGSDLPTEGTAIPTFHSIGLYWTPPSPPLGDAVAIRYRRSTDAAWHTGHDLWYDRRTGVGYQPRPAEARGSIVHCDPATEYTVQFGMPQSDGTVDWTAQLTVTTWDEHFPIGTTLTPWTGTRTELTHSSYLGSRSGSTRAHVLLMDESGTPEGYTLYDLTGSTAQTTNESNHFPVVIQGSYMILRGLTVVGGEDGVFIDPGSHHIVIEDCDISSYGRSSGRPLPNGLPGEHGLQEDAGIKFPDSSYGSILDTQQIVVQRNRIHNPFAGSNSWDSGHPLGATAIMMYPTGGNNVFRYNEAYSTTNGELDGEPDLGHFHEDGLIMGGENDQGIGPDTDIYRNVVRHYWDDGLETDGDGTNDRIWGNYFDLGGATAVSTTSNNLGPVYIWRNVYDRVRMWYADPWGDERDRVAAFKSGAFSDATNGGRRYLYHNTTLQRPYGSEDAPGPNPLGAGQGAGGASGYGMVNTVSRNNVFEIWKAHWGVFALDGAADDDLDYDLTNGRMDSATEPNGLAGTVPQYQSGSGWASFAASGPASGTYLLEPGTPGYDDGARIPNFDDDVAAPYQYTGAGPDRGAHEDGYAEMRFGRMATGS